MAIDFFTIYRLVLTGLSLYNLVRVARSAMQYKAMADRVPLWLRRFIGDRSRELFGRALYLHRRDVAINVALLVVLIVLTLLSWWI